jgi:hypothetical protein
MIRSKLNSSIIHSLIDWLTQCLAQKDGGPKPAVLQGMYGYSVQASMLMLHPGLRQAGAGCDNKPGRHFVGLCISAEKAMAVISQSHGNCSDHADLQLLASWVRLLTIMLGPVSSLH